MRLLIAVPTYNEVENIPRISQEILNAAPKCHLLFIDDNSPDGTGDLINEISKADKRIVVLHRISKLGIGSAHQTAIKYAYQHGYEILLTMDADLTHDPVSIPEMVDIASTGQIVVASRFIGKDGISTWTLRRKLLTKLGHLLTRSLLNLPYDATGAFRAYNLQQIDKSVFNLIISTGYSFFFESLKILDLNGIKVQEISVKLSSMSKGKSKMKMKDILKSIRFMLYLGVRSRLKKQQLIID